MWKILRNQNQNKKAPITNKCVHQVDNYKIDQEMVAIGRIVCHSQFPRGGDSMEAKQGALTRVGQEAEGEGKM